MPPSVIDKFSTRSRLIDRVAEKLGITDQKAKAKLGAALSVLEVIAWLRTAEVTEILRQKDPGYEAVALLSKGRTDDGFDKLDAMGRVKLLPMWDSHELVAKDFADKIERASEKHWDKAALIVCPTHVEGRKITEQVREELKVHGILGTEERKFARPCRCNGRKSSAAMSEAITASLLFGCLWASELVKRTASRLEV